MNHRTLWLTLLTINSLGQFHQEYQELKHEGFRSGNNWIMINLVTVRWPSITFITHWFIIYNILLLLITIIWRTIYISTPLVNVILGYVVQSKFIHSPDAKSGLETVTFVFYPRIGLKKEGCDVWFCLFVKNVSTKMLLFDVNLCLPIKEMLDPNRSISLQVQILFPTFLPHETLGFSVVGPFECFM